MVINLFWNNMRKSFLFCVYPHGIVGSCMYVCMYVLCMGRFHSRIVRLHVLHQTQLPHSGIAIQVYIAATIACVTVNNPHSLPHHSLPLPSARNVSYGLCAIRRCWRAFQVVGSQITLHTGVMHWAGPFLDGSLDIELTSPCEKGPLYGPIQFNHWRCHHN